jgi:hypothetical protein
MDPVTTCAAVTVTHWWPLLLYVGMAGGFALGVLTAALCVMAGRDSGGKGGEP